MQTYNVIIPASVSEKIEDQALYIAMDKPEVALAWYEDLHEQISTLENFPERCPLAPENQYTDDEIRHLLFGDYRVLFSVVDQDVFVLEFKSGKQDKPSY